MVICSGISRVTNQFEEEEEEEEEEEDDTNERTTTKQDHDELGWWPLLRHFLIPITPSSHVLRITS